MESKMPHRGISMHRMPVPRTALRSRQRADFFACDPALWFVVVGALAVSLVIAAVLQVLHRKPPESAKLTIRI
jgi:hypothetical protein